jgi:ATP-binding cassette subfamily F protein 3
LSGGEKSRLALVKLLLDPPNLLLMDEPTTHLDLASVDALIEALKQYEGTLIFISHDVHFIRALANHVCRVEDGQLRHFTGGYQYYLDKTAQSARAALTSSFQGAAAGSPHSGRAGTPSAATEPQVDRKEQRRQEAEQRQARSRKKKEIQKHIAAMEKEIAGLEAQQHELAAESGGIGAGAVGALRRRLTKRRSRVSRKYPGENICRKNNCGLRHGGSPQ